MILNFRRPGVVRNPPLWKSAGSLPYRWWLPSLMTIFTHNKSKGNFWAGSKKNKKLTPPPPPPYLWADDILLSESEGGLREMLPGLEKFCKLNVDVNKKQVYDI